MCSSDLSAPVNLRRLSEVEHRYSILTPEELTALPAKMVALAVDADSPDPKVALLRGVALSWQAGQAAYVRCDNGIPDALKIWLQREDVLKVGYDLKYDLNVLLWQDLPIAGGWLQLVRNCEQSTRTV